MMCTKQGMYNALVVGEMFHSASLPVNASQYNFCFCHCSIWHYSHMYRLQHLQVLKINIKFHHCISLAYFNGPKPATLLRCRQSMQCSTCTKQAARWGWWCSCPCCWYSHGWWLQCKVMLLRNTMWTSVAITQKLNRLLISGIMGNQLQSNCIDLRRAYFCHLVSTDT